MSRRLAWVKSVCLILGMTVVLLFALELVSVMLFDFRDSLASKANIDRRATADTYSQAAWPVDYYRELENSDKASWVSYVYWRRIPFRGHYINVDDEGLRVTWSPDGTRSAAEKHDLNIMMLGGSTMWGLGARDEFTIPSLLAKKLTEHSIRAQVTNFGQIGYVSTQEMIALMLELRKGNTPDIVVFYDGFNDTMSAYQMGEAGLPQNEFKRVREFNSSKLLNVIPFRKAFAENLSSVRLAKAVLHRAGFMGTAEAPNPEQAMLLDSYTKSKAEPLARGVVEAYRTNLETVKALSRHFGFKVLFYWQPLLYDKVPRTSYEEENKKAHAKFEKFFEKTYQAIRTSDLEQSNAGMFHDLSQIFSDTPSPVFVDWCHLGETGNAVIADRMMRDVLRLVHQKKS
jgi:lysophospholipase L1-like esterase